MHTGNHLNILLWGHLVIDHNELADKQQPKGPGGPVYFCAKVLQNLGDTARIVSHRGKDYDDTWLQGLKIYPARKHLAKTLAYRNIYDASGSRTLIAQHVAYAQLPKPHEIPPELFTQSDAVVICPLTDAVSRQNMDRLRKTLNDDGILACLPQGFFRRVDTDGRVLQANWEDAQDFAKLLDIIVLSEEDGTDIDTHAALWSRHKAIVAVTRAEQGCSVYDNGIQHDFPAFPVQKVIDPVGAGDVFAAGFIHSYVTHRNIAQAAQFANAAGSLSVCCHPQDIQFTTQDVEELIAKATR